MKIKKSKDQKNINISDQWTVKAITYQPWECPVSNIQLVKVVKDEPKIHVE